MINYEIISKISVANDGDSIPKLALSGGGSRLNIS